MPTIPTTPPPQPRSRPAPVTARRKPDAAPSRRRDNRSSNWGSAVLGGVTVWAGAGTAAIAGLKLADRSDRIRKAAQAPQVVTALSGPKQQGLALHRHPLNAAIVAGRGLHTPRPNDPHVRNALVSNARIREVFTKNPHAVNFLSHRYRRSVIPNMRVPDLPTNLKTKVDAAVSANAAKLKTAARLATAGKLIVPAGVLAAVAGGVALGLVTRENIDDSA